MVWIVRFELKSAKFPHVVDTLLQLPSGPPRMRFVRPHVQCFATIQTLRCRIFGCEYIIRCEIHRGITEILAIVGTRRSFGHPKFKRCAFD